MEPDEIEIEAPEQLRRYRSLRALDGALIMNYKDSILYQMKESFLAGK